MKVVHIESGLGNQMLGYLEYLVIKKNHPDENCYIETIIYEIEEAGKTICQWNGYELDNIFRFNAPNVRKLFTEEQWQMVLKEVKDSRFWEKEWQYPEAICTAFDHCSGVHLKNRCVSNAQRVKQSPFRKKISEFFNTSLGYNIRRLLIKINPKPFPQRTAQPERLFFHDSEDVYCGFTLRFMYKGNQIEQVDELIRTSFQFPEITNEKDQIALQKIKESNSVAIHVRRGDAIGYNKRYYRGGYFRRAVTHIKKNVSNPVFFIFCDPGSVKWAQENLKQLGLTKQDTVHFVDWNSGEQSFRDMQLMSNCKHAVISVSSFGWWGAYLISNKDKITISPEVGINTTYHC